MTLVIVTMWFLSTTGYCAPLFDGIIPFKSQPHYSTGGNWSIDNGIIEVVWSNGKHKGLYLRSHDVDGKPIELARLTGEALYDIQFYSSKDPFSGAGVTWQVDKIGQYSLRMVTYLGQRRLTRYVSMSPDSAIIHVIVQIQFDGDEITDHILDNWTFSSDNKKPDFIWVPNLRPGPDMVIGDHVFRSPAIILKNDKCWVSMIPDLDTLAALKRGNMTSMNLDLKDPPQPVFTYGIKTYTSIPHTYYRHADSSVLALAPGEYSYAYDILAGTKQSRLLVLNTVTQFLWSHYALKYTHSVLPQTIPFSKYAGYAYPTLDSLAQFVRFKLDSTEVGAYKGIDHGGYFRLPYPIIWNQDWFNVQRSAYGLRHYGTLLNKPHWVRQAKLITSFTLHTPQYDGLSPAIYDLKNNQWIGSVPRLNGGKNRIHTSCSAWTGYWLLKWYEDFDKDQAILTYVRRLGDFLVANQSDSGSIPAWFKLPDGNKEAPKAVETLKNSAETAGSALLLGELYNVTKKKSYKSALLRSADFLIRSVLPEMKFWDFETFWSCSWKPLTMRDPYTGVLPQNNLSIFWSAKVLFEAYSISHQDEYLHSAEETLDILSLYQQVWNPPFLSLYTFGGFGVMNTDGEWNDARQAVFAPLYLRAYQLTGKKEYFERGIAALRASFVLMSIPENKQVAPDTWNAYPVGLMPENFAHAGKNGTYGRSDTDWGEAGALSASALITSQFGDVYIDASRKQAFGIDGIKVIEISTANKVIHLIVKEELGYPRTIVFKTDTGHRFVRKISAHQTDTYEFTI